GRIIAHRKRRARPKGCGRRTTGRCRVRYVTVEREFALARRLTTWNPGPGRPPAAQVDVESVLLRLFGMLAGNVADAPACSGDLLLRATGVTPGWWWRSPSDTFRPRCPAR
ncbi:MAG TPA: hypothetical protein VD931_00605, partial [Baekduia sp.]|nr:hypothetical protein [Baekduia sp.]